MALEDGSSVAGYRIVRLLGAGGMGTVYLAVNPVLPRQDALKVLSAELSKDESFRTRFVREADLAASLDHPNIVTVYTRGQTEQGELWIAMQYVDGSDALKESDAGRLTVLRTLHIVTEVAKALDYAHRRNLVHRDVKPANFLLAAHDDRVLLADFGVARALDDPAGLTGTGAVLTTIAYAAPETFESGRLDHRADIYALGCSLYRMLTGATPFASAGSPAAMIGAHLHQPAPRATDRVPRLPVAVDAVIAKAMAKNPEDRYQTALQLADAARTALLGSPVHAESGKPPVVPAPQRFTPPPEQYRSPPRPTPSHPAPTGPRRRGGRWLAASALLVVVATVVAVVWWQVAEPESTYRAQSFTHSRGVTELDTQPAAVVAVGVGDADDVLSLGLQPVAIVTPGELPSWERELITGDVAVLTAVDAAALRAAQPDLVIATQTVTDAEFATLAAVAPTVTQPPDATHWPWQDRLQWVARVLGREDAAGRLLSVTSERLDTVRSEHPAFAGKRVEIVNVGDDGVTVSLADSNAARYLEGLGFQYSDELVRGADDGGDARPVDDVTTINPTSVDVRVVVRTDEAAGGGGYNGLPKPFSEYKGITVIVDDVNVIAALDSGGYAATEFLDQHLVSTLGRQIH